MRYTLSAEKMKAKISEIFKSIQGEGIYAGVQQVFVRFHGCNLHCAWCDTRYSAQMEKGSYREYEVGQLVSEVDALWSDCHSVSLTGGEPLLQKDFLMDFLPELRKFNLRIYLETNGVLYDELQAVIDQVDIIAMDIKLPSSTELKDYWEEHKKFLDMALQKEVFIKVVVSENTDQEDIQRAVNIVRQANPNLSFILQPSSTDINSGAMTKCLECHKCCLKDLPHARVIPQIHKLMGVR